jgi:ribonuclease HII
MVRKKKEVIQPVVAKPLNDNHKRNLVTSFVTNNIKENVTHNDTNNVSNNSTVNVTNNDIEELTNNVSEKDTDLVNVNDTNTVTKSSTENVTKKVTKTVTTTKIISIGKKDIIAKFTSDKRVRPNYNLSEDTVEKIEKISDILGYKKAEFVDIYLNGTLDKILKNLEKNK